MAVDQYTSADTLLDIDRIPIQPAQVVALVGIGRAVLAVAFELRELRIQLRNSGRR